jgi:hypothetical protein
MLTLIFRKELGFQWLGLSGGNGFGAVIDVGIVST